MIAIGAVTDVRALALSAVFDDEDVPSHAELVACPFGTAMVVLAFPNWFTPLKSVCTCELDVAVAVNVPAFDVVLISAAAAILLRSAPPTTAASVAAFVSPLMSTYPIADPVTLSRSLLVVPTFWDDE